MVALVLAVTSAPAADTNSVSPASGGKAILFNRDVQPIFEQSCFRCHGPEKPKSGYRLDNRDSGLKGGDNNQNDIVPGHSDQSKLIAYVAGLDKDIRMPPPDHGQPLTRAQVDTLRAWVDQGADWGTNAAPPAVTFSIESAGGWTGVSGDNQKFRELEGVHEGWSGGAEHFSYRQQLAPDETLTIEGHALVPQNDFKVTVALDKKDSGFMHSGFEEWRRYYDDTGGYFPLITPASFSLDQDTHLDIGRAWVDFGLTLPDSPELVLGYEYQFRQGEKPTLVWGTVLQGPFLKNIFPNIENVDEQTHIFKVDLTREWDDWSFEDRVRAEFYNLSEQRNDGIGYTGGPNPAFLQQVNQGVQYSQGANTLRVEKQIADWWRASAGCLLSVFDGTSSFNRNTTDGSGTPVPGQSWSTEGITLHRNSYIGSLGSLFLPLDGLSISAAAQSEWTHETGMGGINLDPTPGAVSANQDRTTLSENLNARYARLPCTVLFAEARLQQQSVGQFAAATDTSGNPNGILYNSVFGSVSGSEQRISAYNYLYDTRVGFTSSPRSWFEWGGHYRYRDSNTKYDHLLDTTLAFPAAYPAFITRRDIALDEIEGRLVLRPVYWLNARLTYRWTETDFSSNTDPVPGGISNGGYISDGSTLANNLGLSLNFTPGQRFYCSASLTYGYSRTTTAGDQNPAVVPYRGNTYTVGTSAGYALNAKTHLNATYAFSQAGYGQNNNVGLPLGIDFTRNDLLVGLTRQLTSRLSGALRYGFSQYTQPSNGGVNNFTAQGIFASVSYKWK